ncbi:MAG: NCS1 family nucleobase:cation symporter-1 [Ignavibacteriales bacterium]|nr:NCS1 family nucleobase:cation symporter-1 [Ignavibacteriales bacterium]
MPPSFVSELSEIDLSSVSGSTLINKDIAPTRIAERTWNTYHIAALWIGMCVCIPTYMLAAGLIAGGMNWWQAILTITLGNVIVLIPMILNAHAGTKYGIPFPVLVRASFGTLGANVPSILRALVACGWFGIQTWIGGAAINAMLMILLPFWKDFGPAPWISFAIFWLMNIYFIVNGTESIKKLEALAAPFLLLVGVGLLGWAISEGGGLGPILSQPSKFETAGEFWMFFFPALTGMVGFWATLSLNIPDFTRYARGQKEQMMGQLFGLPLTMAFYSFIGVAVTSATVIVFGNAIWDPVVLLSKFENPAVILISMLALSIATLTTNLAANVVAPANGFSNLSPRKINFVRGGLITAFIGIAMMPWKLLEDFSAYIFGWLVGYSGFLGPIAGILIADYFVIRKRDLRVKDLYERGGMYEYSRGFNPVALAALGAGVFVAMIGLFVDQVRFLYDYAWFVGFAVAFMLYAVTMKRGKSESLKKLAQ